MSKLILLNLSFLEFRDASLSLIKVVCLLSQDVDIAYRLYLDLDMCLRVGVCDVVRDTYGAIVGRLINI